MKIVLLDSMNAKVIYLDVEDAMIGDDTEGWLGSHGYDKGRYSWFAITAEYIPIDFHRYAAGEEGEENHARNSEILRFGTPFQREKDFKEREAKECVLELLKYGIHKDGTFTKRFEGDERPIVAGYFGDEPCDIIVNSVIVDVGNWKITVIGCDKNDPSTEKEIPESELFAGQLSEITERICE